MRPLCSIEPVFQAQSVAAFAEISLYISRALLKWAKWSLWCGYFSSGHAPSPIYQRLRTLTSIPQNMEGYWLQFPMSTMNGAMNDNLYLLDWALTPWSLHLSPVNLCDWHHVSKPCSYSIHLLSTTTVLGCKEVVPILNILEFLVLKTWLEPF